MLGRLLLAITLCAAMLGVATPAGAHPLAHPTAPRITNLRPAAGEVVSGDEPVTIAVLALTDAVRDARISVDGRPLLTAIEVASHPTISADADGLAAGDHIATVSVTDTQGRTAERAWRFTVADLRVTRLAGAARAETAVTISQGLYPVAGSAEAAVLARADDFPDALAGVPAAQAVDAPLLLTDPDGLTPATRDELRRVLPAGETVYLLGGTAALSAQVEADVEALGLEPERIAGDSRYATAAALATLQAETATASPPPETATASAPSARATAFVVAGTSFADALSASAPAAIEGAPVLLTPPDALASETRDYLADVEPETVYVIGGTGAVSAAVEAELRDLVPTVARIAGPSRYDTADAIAKTFFDEAVTVAVANGERFPDALAGGRHAASLGAPLLLATADGLLAPQLTTLGRAEPSRAVLYGGPAALGAGVESDLLRGVADAGGPQVTAITPTSGTELHTLDELVITFDRDLQVEHSVVYVTLGGNEVAGTVRAGDFPTTLVFKAAELPNGLAAGETYDLRVTVAALSVDGQHWRHLDERYTFRKLDLSRGDEGPLVADLQNRLVANGYWLGAVDGAFGTLTHQAVMAFQKVHGLTRDGVYGAATRSLLESNPPRPAARSSSGLVMEVDKARQVLLMVRGGQVEWVFNTSTGTEQPYTYEGQSYLADTPPGRWTINRQIDGVREGNLGRLYRPKYFHPDGIAIHGSSSVPAYPASHGCVRVTNAAIDWLWAGDRMPLGTTVLVY